MIPQFVQLTELHSTRQGRFRRPFHVAVSVIRGFRRDEQDGLTVLELIGSGEELLVEEPPEEIDRRIRQGALDNAAGLARLAREG